MEISKIIKQEYIEFIVESGHSFDAAIVSPSTNKTRKHLEDVFFTELREQNIPVLSNMRLVEKETLVHILKKVEKANYKKLKNFFTYEENVIEDLCRIIYDDDIEKYFNRLEKKGFNIGDKSFVLPETIDVEDFFSAREILEELEDAKIEMFEDLNADFNGSLFNSISDESANGLRELGVRIFDSSLIFNSKRKMYQFLMYLEESHISDQNYKVSSTKNLYKVDIDSKYMYENRIEKLLSYKNGFRKGQFTIINYRPHLSNCIEYLIYTQETLEK